MRNSDVHMQENEMKMDVFQEEMNNLRLEEEKEIEQQKSLIAFKGLSKVKIKEVAILSVQSVLDEGNPLEVAEALSSMELFIKEVKGDERFKNYVREELEKEKSYTSASGTKIELSETGTKYDFSKCDDFILESLLEQQEEITLKVDERKKFLKTLPLEGMDILNKNTGELVKVYPPSKSSTSGYKVTLSK